MLDYGPLTQLIGTWTGNQGMDVAPESEGIEKNPYYETMTFEACGDLTNGEEQVLHVIRYLQIVKRQSNGEVFHDQTGYWIWEPATGQVMFTLSIPRGVTLLAGGNSEQNADGSTTIKVQSSADDAHWRVAQSPFMDEKAKTKSFTMALTVSGEELRYQQSTMLDIYGKEFDHTDGNILKRV